MEQGETSLPVTAIILTNYDLHYDISLAHLKSTSQSPISIIVMWSSDLHCNFNPALKNNHKVHNLKRVNLKKLKSHNLYLINTVS